jgi:hypothetical protein
MVSEGARSPDWLGRGIGLAVFFLGIVLLILVFVWTSKLSTQVPKRLDEMNLAFYVRIGVQVVQLFVLGLVASWISGRGAQLYAAANRALSGD